MDSASSEIVWSEQGHDDNSAVWSIDIRPDGKGFMTGGADHWVRFWNFEVKKVKTR